MSQSKLLWQAISLAELLKVNTELAEKVAKLSKNSSNSTKPPSSDIFKPPKAKQADGPRHQGGQSGHNHISLQRSSVVLFRLSEGNFDFANSLTRFAFNSRNPHAHLDPFTANWRQVKNSGLAAGSDDLIASITGTVEIFWVDRGVTRAHYRLTIAFSLNGRKSMN